MEKQKRVLRRNVLSLVVMAGTMYTPSVCAQEGTQSEFLSVIENVVLPPSAPSGSGKGASPDNEVDALREALRRLKKQNTELEKNRAQTGKKLAGLTAENNRLREENRRLTDNTSRPLSPSESHGAGTPEAEKRLEEMREALTKAGRQVQSLREENDALKHSLNEQQQRHDGALQQEIAMLKEKGRAETDGAGQKLRALEQQLAETRDSLARSTASDRARGEKVTALEAEIVNLKAGYQKKENEILKLSGAVKEAEVLRSRLTELSTLRDILQQKLDMSVKDSSRQRETVMALKDNLRTAEGAVKEKMAEQQKEIAGLRESRDALQQELKAAQLRIQSSGQEKETLQQQVRAANEEAGKKQAALEDRLAAADTQLKAVIAEREQMAARLRKTEEAETKDRPGTVLPGEERRTELKTDTEKQAYASGVAFSRNITQLLGIHQDLGLKLPTALMLAGLNDGINNTLLLDEQTLRDSYRTVASRLASLEKEKYDAGLKQLEKITAKATVLKRNQTLFFVQNRKGAGRIAGGDSVVFDLTESVVNGKVLRSEKGVNAVINDSLPYMVQQALTLAGRGGEITVYSMVSDVYSPGNIPEGLYPYSLLKYNFKVSAKMMK
ncbi:hypothetical protein CDG14_20985 [Salmonella enterica]|nr:hypothetical protein [Salmonella enterica]EDU2778940.1 hypothetical protein [Salmonella enterica subsp. enterica serovar Javiana]HEI8935350.1 hypothetical protein [Citrobacter freundii]EDW5422360.1 hypothetical protein [Salmonella enterica subsp. enterica serovar Javiana]EGZ4395775.1 hypothetical protein [Salmonella enterica subsp. enterica serovar Javiana]